MAQELPRKYRKFSPEFRDEAVRLVIDNSRPIAQVARELGVNEGTLHIEHSLRHALQLVGPTGRAGDDGIPCANRGQDVGRCRRRLGPRGCARDSAAGTDR